MSGELGAGQKRLLVAQQVQPHLDVERRGRKLLSIEQDERGFEQMNRLGGRAPKTISAEWQIHVFLMDAQADRATSDASKKDGLVRACATRRVAHWCSTYVPVHGVPVVGSPKHLSDLDKIEADVRITCRRCGFEDDWSTADLSRHLLSIGGSTAWSEITRFLTCRRFGCGSPDLRALPVPFARRKANLRRRVGALDTRILDVSLGILSAAVTRQAAGAAATPEVQLALLVIYRYTRDRAAVRLFWERASKSRPTVNDGLLEPLDAIRDALVKRGWIAPEILLQRTRVWPWSTPAPRGWLASASAPEHENDD